MDNWEFNKLGIENFNNPQTRMFKYFEFIKNNCNKLSGDILEFGVYKGKSLFSTALLLKKLNSDKKIYAFDSYCGLKSFVDPKDDISNFYTMHKNGLISNSHFLNIKKLEKFNSFLNKGNDTLNISKSNDFSATSLDYLKKKAEFLNLDNIVFVKGPFDETINKYKNISIFCCNIDCDLYKSYKCCLPFVYSSLVDGGFIHLDEYYSLKFPGAKLFCDEYVEKNNIKLLKHVNNIDKWERWYILK